MQTRLVPDNGQLFVLITPYTLANNTKVNKESLLLLKILNDDQKWNYQLIEMRTNPWLLFKVLTNLLLFDLILQWFLQLIVVISYLDWLLPLHWSENGNAYKSTDVYKWNRILKNEVNINTCTYSQTPLIKPANSVS